MVQYQFKLIQTHKLNLDKQSELLPKFRSSDSVSLSGGTIMRTIADIVKRGAQAENIRVISIVASPIALQKLSPAYPGEWIIHFRFMHDTLHVSLMYLAD